jgi:hypothetical protein
MNHTQEYYVAEVKLLFFSKLTINFINIKKHPFCLLFFSFFIKSSGSDTTAMLLKR